MEGEGLGTRLCIIITSDYEGGGHSPSKPDFYRPVWYTPPDLSLLMVHLGSFQVPGVKHHHPSLGDKAPQLEASDLSRKRIVVGCKAPTNYKRGWVEHTALAFNTSSIRDKLFIRLGESGGQHTERGNTPNPMGTIPKIHPVFMMNTQ